MNELSKIQVCHDTFCQETGVKLRLGIGEYFREQTWARFIAAGFTDEDIRFVCRHLKAEVYKGKRFPGSMRFSNLIERLENFEEELQLAKGALIRKPKPTSLDRAMHQLRPTVAHITPDETRSTAVPISTLIENLKAAAGMNPA